jgi:hypothetical protein
MLTGSPNARDADAKFARNLAPGAISRSEFSCFVAGKDCPGSTDLVATSGSFPFRSVQSSAYSFLVADPFLLGDRP